jgi:hypothetical protein
MQVQRHSCTVRNRNRRIQQEGGPYAPITIVFGFEGKTNSEIIRSVGPIQVARIVLGQVSRRIQFGPQLLPEIEGLISDVDNTTVFEKEIRAD